MSRSEREAELYRFMLTKAGRDAIFNLYYFKASGIPVGRARQPGILGSQMIEAILNHEYPPKA
jgi:hypothetical protein